jgi:hypothetical protein
VTAWPISRTISLPPRICCCDDQTSNLEGLS